MRTLTALGTAVACASMLAGCGALVVATPTEASPTPTYTAPSTFAWSSACDLLDGVDVAGLLGEEPAAPTESKGTRCQMAGSTKSSIAVFGLYITSPGGADDFAYQKQLQGVDNEIPGLGDAAFQSGGYLNVLVGDNEISLVVFRGSKASTAPTLAELTAAARTILANAGWGDAAAPSPTLSPTAS